MLHCHCICRHLTLPLPPLPHHAMAGSAQRIMPVAPEVVQPTIWRDSPLFLQHAMAKSAQRIVVGFTSEQECAEAYCPVSQGSEHRVILS